MRPIKADGNTLSVSVSGDFLILSRPYDEEHEHLLTEGASLDGDTLTKAFPRSRFFATKAEIEAQENLFHTRVDFVSGMSGYSSLDEKRCTELGIRVGEYESAVMGIMTSAINRVRHLMPKIRYGLVFGSSSMGVDLAIEKVAREQNLPLLGYICLAYLWYVDNGTEGAPICIMSTKEAYCEAFVAAADLLMACNGGEVSYQMDMIAAMKRFIPVMPINIIGMLGASIPAFKNGKVNDAVGVLLHGLRLIRIGNAGQGLAEDRFQTVADDFADAVTARAREVAPPQYAFEALRK